MMKNTALITGGSRGIGLGIARKLAEKGYWIAINGIRNEKEITGTLQELGSRTEKVIYCQGNIAIKQDRETILDTVKKEFGHLNVLVNNAGILHSTPVEEITEAEWDKILAVNLKSVFFTSQKVLPHMKQKGWGRIINMSSLAGRMGGYKNGLAYSASKAGIIGVSRGLATRVAEFGITVNAIAPGTTESDIIKQFSAEAKEDLKKMIPLGRLGATADIANLALFLASDISGFITGAVIDINGGMYLG